MTARTAPPPVAERPRAVLRIGFAGRRDLTPTEGGNLDRALDRVLGRFARQLVALAPSAAGGDAAPAVTAFYDPTRPPVLRLVTGLCEGADTAAAQALERLAAPPGGAGPGRPPRHRRTQRQPRQRPDRPPGAGQPGPGTDTPTGRPPGRQAGPRTGGRAAL